MSCYKQFFYIYDSFKYANEIVLVISSVSNIKVIKEIISNLAVKHKIILGIRKAVHYASSNRNYGFLLSKCNIVSFFDMDDLMSVNRLPVLYNLFKHDKTIEFILHKYVANCSLLKSSKYSYKNIDTYKFNLSYNYIYNSYVKSYKKDKPNKRWCCKYIEIIKHEKIHNGWPTMRRYILERIKYNNSYEIGEDVDFNTNIILNKYNVTILNYSLGYYIRDNKCKNYYKCKYF